MISRGDVRMMIDTGRTLRTVRYRTNSVRQATMDRAAPHFPRLQMLGCCRRPLCKSIRPSRSQRISSSTGSPIRQ